MKKYLSYGHLLVGLVICATTASTQAGVSSEEAEKLKSELTPLGAERAGNKDGTIPAWTGGMTVPIKGDKPGGTRGDPFANDKPKFSIDAKNADQYSDKLSEGVMALLKKYPEYRLDVYETRRTAAAPQWVYDNTFKNATRASMKDDVPVGAFGGPPFPIPKTGAEVMANHVLRWRGTTVFQEASLWQITADGRPVLTNDASSTAEYPYYYPEGTAEEFAKNPEYYLVRVDSSAPAIRAGEAIVGRNNIYGDKTQAWVYLTGQRRVRKVPNVCCDTPSPVTAGLLTFDEHEVFDGRLERMDFKIVGKKEMYIPYNGNRMLQPKKPLDVIGAHYPKPETMRWELHRTWVVESTVRQGYRHQAKRSRYYCDEDTWICALADRWDANGQLWKTLWANPIVAPDLPGVVMSSFGFNDLLSGSAYISSLHNGKPAQYVIKPRSPKDLFTPESMASGSIR